VSRGTYLMPCALEAADSRLVRGAQQRQQKSLLHLLMRPGRTLDVEDSVDVPFRYASTAEGLDCSANDATVHHRQGSTGEQTDSTGRYRMN
jgi:hypothetical protein